MSYHPIMGMTFFFIFIIIAFYLGRNSLKTYSKKKIGKLKQKEIITDNISPDAWWLK
tara:strand:+ start:54 stop:224 length:171 start_codon:yes stop_codon:yes gene_type:complete